MSSPLTRFLATLNEGGMVGRGGGCGQSRRKMGDPDRSLGQEDALEEAWNPLQYSRLENPRQEPGGLQSMGSQSQTQLSN